MTPLQEIAEEVVCALERNHQIAPFSSRFAGFNLEQAYEIQNWLCHIRSTHGDEPVGRKIGFTNVSVWNTYGISSPIWGFMFQSTVHDLADLEGSYHLRGLCEPRIEPEIALHIERAPHPDMSDDELIGCIDWIAPGFEIVQSIFPGWAFSAADAVVAGGVHSALLLGERRSIVGKRAQWADDLLRFTVRLVRNDGLAVPGRGQDVLGSPVKALRFLVQELARYPASKPLAAGEIVTTGTLTAAMPAISGESWSTEFSGIDLPSQQLHFE